MQFPPIAVMSFNRPDYLREVLASLAGQRDGAAQGRDVFLFQDGSRNPYSGRICAEPADIEACCAVFREFFPKGHVLASPDNLGVALNFLRAETTLFRELGADCAYFFEDDLVLAPRYLAALDTLREAAEPTGEVGYFACYGHLTARPEDQLRKARGVRRLAHHWGFGLFRRHWEEMQPAMAEYYEAVTGRDYRDRPSTEILRRYRERGFLPTVSSQDDVKKAVSYGIGRASLNTELVNARYIGAVGLHMTAAKFEQAGYARTVWVDVEELAFDLPDAAGFAAMREAEAEARRRAIAASEAEEARRAEAAAAARNAPRPKPAAQPPATPAAAAPAPASRLGKPRMDPEELQLFERVLDSGRRRYAEFGVGGSTLLAVRRPFDLLIGVESDPGWARSVRENEEVARAIAAGRAAILHADIGAVGAWGSPVDRTAIRPWPNYVARMWEEWGRRGSFPDLVLVDGRFRVACCLSVALLSARSRTGREPPLLVLHDVQDSRPNYYRVFDFFHLEEQVGTLCVFTPRQLVPPETILAAMLDRLFEVV